MADAPRVMRESAAKATVTPLPGSRPPPAQQGQPTPAAQPEPKRTKSERLEAGRGYWTGFAHGKVSGLIIGIALTLATTGALLPIVSAAFLQAKAIERAGQEMGR